MKSNMFWYTIFMSIQRLCYLGGGGGSITEALPGVRVQGEKSIHLRVTEEQRAQLILRGRFGLVCLVLNDAPTLVGH